MVCAVVVEDICCVVRCPLLRVSTDVRFSAHVSIGQKDVDDLPFVVDAEDVLQTTGGQNGVRVRKLRNVAQLSEV